MHNESGRSLVEIFAVLAIIGILSIAGTVGYKLAIYRYVASQVIDTNNKFAFLIYERCRNIYEAHNTSLQSIQNCTPNTPGIPTFEEARIGNFPDCIFNKGIYFREISQPENSTSYIIHTQLRFKTKEHCLAVKSIKNLDTGCKGSSAPYTLTLETVED